DQPVDLAGGQADTAFSQRRDQLSGGEHPTCGHDLPQMPPIVQLGRHHRPLPTVGSSPSAGASARRSAVFMKSLLTCVYTAVELSTSWPTWHWMNRRSTPFSVRCET